MKHILFFFLFVTSIFAQDITLKGKVVNSESNEILTGANIQVENSNIGVITDSKGEFVLNSLSLNDVIVVSYIGFAKEKITVKRLSKSLLIALKPKILSTQSIVIEGFSGKDKKESIGYSEIDRKSIETNYTNQTVPELLSNLPSTTFYSDDGGSIGYSYVNIRGFDQRRISISVNGIPQNDPEDHNVYWIDIPDILGSSDLIQVQRGSGNSVVGYPSIGGSINIITSPFSDKNRIEFGAYFGSYNIRQYYATVSSGLIDNKYSVYAKIGQTLKSGYRDLAWANYKSYNLSVARYDDNLTTQINIYGGPIEDGLVYYGLPKNVIKDKSLRTENYSYWDYDYENNEYQPWSTKRRPEEKEYYSQPHFELLNDWNVSEDVTVNSALFWIIGNGYFDFDGNWADTTMLRLTSDYGFSPTQNPSNILIRAHVDNNQFGWIPRIAWNHGNGKLTAGAEIRLHESSHFGEIAFAEGLPSGLLPNRRFYSYNGGKNIFNAFLNENYSITADLNLLAELQIANHTYSISNEDFVNTDFEIGDTYFNPKFGLSYNISNKLNSFISFARVTREPRLKNYYEAEGSYYGETPKFETDVNGNYDFAKPLIKPETMNDIEFGLNYFDNDLTLSSNFYYMLFENEIVKNGQVGIFGDPITGNMPSTVHTGLEFTGSYKITNWLNFTANLTYSKNYITEGTHIIDENTSLDLKDNKIGGFPELLSNIVLTFNKNNFSGSIIGKYVGEYYSDNFEENLSAYLNESPYFVDYNDNLVEAYFVLNAIVNYEFSINNIFPRVKVFGQVNNITDNLYAAYAVGKEYFPAAERNFLFGINLGL